MSLVAFMSDLEELLDYATISSILQLFVENADKQQAKSDQKVVRPFILSKNDGSQTPITFANVTSGL